MIVSLTIVRYRKAFIPFALIAMAVLRLPMFFQQKCTFYKLMGSGKNGTFDFHPDWQQWALLAVWEDEESFDYFNQNSFISKWWKHLTAEKWTVLLKPLQSHGLWDKKEPFGKPNKTDYEGPVAVLTRATINLNRLKHFWQNAAKVAGIMSAAKGYITSFGIGEDPFRHQATVSFWKDLEDVKNFAYRLPEHVAVIKKTRSENWYSEELFARFIPLKAWGTIRGKNPLKNFIPDTTLATHASFTD
ncbi:DUF3291 domain-containing protein [Mucilaginibacter arboris]|uniref:DUF3291 domain-containing protein n=1 Tax=Mucilaginibacter arboris TaxID=2682090 RepID=A0A7K1SXZ2_9SPHI|nr:DUF3291 domain-containing protein [Mucilaginibacter arboris]MVN22186.1 DUF3291 domain-containing protein [Mucilaginibacter arboris]